MQVTIDYSAELMKNYLHANIMAPREHFSAYQTHTGNTLLFSIATDGALYLTHEIEGITTGWTELNLTAKAAQEEMPGTSTRCKSFSVAQSIVDGTITLAIVLTDGQKDLLLLSFNNPDAADHWTTAPVFTPYPFDSSAGEHPVITNVLVGEVSSVGGSGRETVFADVLRPDGGAAKTVDRYLVVPAPVAGAAHWQPRPKIDLTAGSYLSLPGRAMGDTQDGLYTVGMTGQLSQLVYQQSSDPWGGHPETATLQLPANTAATSIAPCRLEDGHTDLYVTGGDGLYLFPAHGQTNLATGSLLKQHTLLRDTVKLHAFTTKYRTVLFGLTRSNRVYSCYCPSGKSAAPSAWSSPVIILANTDHISPYVNRGNNGSTFFAVGTAGIYKMSQSPQTTLWQSQLITLPQPDPGAVPHEFQSYTVRLKLTDEYNRAVTATEVQVSAATRGAYFINGLYTILTPEPIPVVSDTGGIITIVATADGLAASPITVAYHTDKVTIDPAAKAFGRLTGLDSTAKLMSATIKSADGSTRPLLPSGTSPLDTASLALTNQDLGVAYANLSTPAARSPIRFQPATVSVGHLTLPGGFPLGDAILVDIGDLFNWLKAEADAIVHFVKDKLNGLWHFVVELAGNVYRAVLHVAEQVVAAVRWLYKQVKIAIADLMKFLSFLFSWSDILTTHTILKNYLSAAATHAIGQVGLVKSKLDDAFVNLEQRLDKWSGVNTGFGNADSITASHPSPKGTNSAPANLGTHHFKSHIHQATIATSVPEHPSQAFSSFSDLLANELAVINEAYNQFKTEVIDKARELSVDDLIKRTVDVLLKALLKVSKKAFDAFLQGAEGLLGGAVALLQTPIKIPVLSGLYEKLTGDTLTILDLVCLISAIPATIVADLVSGKTLFPAEESSTQELLAAKHWSDFQRFLTPVSSLSLSTTASASEFSKTNKKLSFAASFAALGGSIGLIAFIWADNKPDLQDSQQATLRGVLSFIANLAYLAPGYRTFPTWNPWATEMNNVLTILAIIKSGVAIGYANSPTVNGVSDIKLPKAVLAMMELFLNVVWCAPPIDDMIEYHEDYNKTYKALIPNFIGSMFFNIGGILEFPAVVTNNPYVKGAQSVMVGGYGLLMPVTYGIFAFGKDQTIA